MLDLERNSSADGDGFQKLRESLLPDLEKSLSKNIDLQWKETLRNEILTAETDLILNGIESEKMKNGSDFLSFCKQSLKLDDVSLAKINVLSVNPMVRANQKDKKPSILIKLAHFSERNICLKNSFNLPKGSSIDRSVPKRYLQKYKELKTKAWKIRTSQSLKTRIDFEGHMLCLKVRKRDEGTIKYGWTIHEEFSPSPSSVPPKYTSKVQPGLTPTPPLSLEKLSKTIIFTNIVSSLKKDDLFVCFEKLFDKKDEIERIHMVNENTFTVECKEAEIAKKLKSKFQDFLFQDRKIKTELARKP